MKTKSQTFSAATVERVAISLPLRSVTLVRMLLLAVVGIAVTSIDAGEDKADVAEITITAHKSELLFDKKEFTVKAGQKVKLTLVNPADSVNLQPHNFLLIEPGTLQEVGTAADAELTDPAFLEERQAVPTSNYVLHHSKLLQPGESETIEFSAPKSADDYPFLCTYPGHWRMMNGVMIVED